MWKPAHTKALLAALGEVHVLVVRAARAIGSQQVNFDGLVHLHGDGVLDVAASTTMFPEALRLWDRLLRTVEQQGGSMSVTKVTTIILDGESIDVRMREGSERRRKEVGKYGFPENQYFPTKQLWLIVIGEHGSQLRMLIQEQRDLDAFLGKLRGHVARLPRLRERREERERAREEEQERWREKWRREEERQRQGKEQQERFNQLFADVEKWTKAERVRDYANAFEAHHVAIHGEITIGSQVDGWLRWVQWYAEHLDPITRPEGPNIGPDKPNEES